MLGEITNSDELQFLNELFKLAGESTVLLEEPTFTPEYKSNADASFTEQNKELLGPEYEEKEYAAIQKLMAEHQGFIRDAFHRKDIGDIALMWGNKKKGLCHIIKRRKEPHQPLGKLLQSMADVVNNGQLERGKRNAFKITFKHKSVIIYPKLDNDDLQFILTAYYEH